MMQTVMGVFDKNAIYASHLHLAESQPDNGSKKEDVFPENTRYVSILNLLLQNTIT